MGSNLFDHQLFTQVFKDTAGDDGLSFQEFPATQDGYLAFHDATQPTSQLQSQLLAGLQTQGAGAFQDSVAKLDAQLQQLRFDDSFADASETAPSEEPTPEWACCYCGASDPACVAKCVSTGKWFCNGRINSHGSCLVVHLVKNRAREVQLHKDSNLGDVVLECYATLNRNVFSLGFVPVRGDNTAVLLARDLPVNNPVVRELGVDMSQWEPIIVERQFAPWVLRVPSDRTRRITRLSQDQVAALEELWKARPTAGLEDLAAAGVAAAGAEVVQEELVPVALRYQDAQQYQDVFMPLVNAEAEYDRQLHEQQRREGLRVRWDVGLNRKKLAFFFFPQDDVEVKLLLGDELRLKHKAAGAKGPWEGTGQVVSGGGATEEVCLEMDRPDVPEDVADGYDLEFVWKGTSFSRMKDAIKQLRVNNASISGYLFHVLMGHEVKPLTLKVALPKSGFSAPSLPELNHSQLLAVRSVLQQPINLIQGPPGTGKTVTSATIVYHICKATNSQVLVCAPSNVAVDQLAAKIAATGLKVVRLAAKSRETLDSPVQNLALHYQVAHVNLPGSDMFKKLRQLKAEKQGLSVADERQFSRLRRQLENTLLEHADVVCTTCVGAGDPRLLSFRFQHVLVDESTQASEAEALIPLTLGAKQVILVGDHCQLGPVIMCKRAAAAGLSMSLFERLRLLGVKPTRLQVQYRMHPCLSEWPSNTFYEGTLQNGTGAGDRVGLTGEFPWPKQDKPMMFWVQLGTEELSSSGTSYINRAEAAVVEKVLTRFLQIGVTPAQLGVITPYEGQRAHVVSVLLRNGTLRQDLYKAIEVSSVDAFQGREKDYIIVSCVRSNEQSGIGFLSDPRRLNVALTRARYGLILLGNPRVLSKQPLWNALLTHFKEHELLVEGPLTNLKPSLIQLSTPKRKFDRGAFGEGAQLVGAIGRYQPPEHVGDPPPAAGSSGIASALARNPAGTAAGLAAAAAMADLVAKDLAKLGLPGVNGAAAAAAGASGSGAGRKKASKVVGSAALGAAGMAAAATTLKDSALAAAETGERPGYLPFAGPSYTISPWGAGRLGSGSSAPGSQLAFATQDDLAGLPLGSSAGISLATGAMGTQAPFPTSDLSLGLGGYGGDMSQGGLGFGGFGGGVGGMGLAGVGDTQGPLSQAFSQSDASDLFHLSGLGTQG